MLMNWLSDGISMAFACNQGNVRLAPWRTQCNFHNLTLSLLRHVGTIHLFVGLNAFGVNVISVGRAIVLGKYQAFHKLVRMSLELVFPRRPSFYDCFF